jgi:hypothetical protein
LVICAVSCSKLGHFATQHGKLFIRFEESSKVIPFISLSQRHGWWHVTRITPDADGDTSIVANRMEAEIASGCPRRPPTPLVDRGAPRSTLL